MSSDEMLSAIIAEWNSCDEQRLKEMQEAYTEAQKWEKDGDGYSKNFHEGKAGGMTSSAIIFHRLKRFVEGLQKQHRTAKTTFVEMQVVKRWLMSPEHLAAAFRYRASAENGPSHFTYLADPNG